MGWSRAGPGSPPRAGENEVCASQWGVGAAGAYAAYSAGIAAASLRWGAVGVANGPRFGSPAHLPFDLPGRPAPHVALAEGIRRPQFARARRAPVRAGG